MKLEEDPLIQSWERLWLRAGRGLRSPLRILAWVFVGIGCLFLALYLWGLGLSPLLLQKQEVLCGQTPRQVQRILSDVSSYPKWRRDVRRVELLSSDVPHSPQTKSPSPKPSFYYREYYTDKKFFLYRVNFQKQEIVFELLPQGLESTTRHASSAQFQAKIRIRTEPLSSQTGRIQTRVLLKEESYYFSPFRRSIARLAAGRRIKCYAMDLQRVCH